MSRKDLMIDIETLSTNNDAAIIAIGVATFRGDTPDENISDEFLIDPRYAPGHRGADTFKWWEMQDPGVFAHATSGTDTPEEAIEKFEDFYHTHRPKHIWANSPQFDLVILRTLYHALGKEAPFHYNRERDFRTLKDLAKNYKIDYSAAYKGRIKQKHNAQSDALCQAAAAQLILDRMSFFAKVGVGSVPTV